MDYTVKSTPFQILRKKNETKITIGIRLTEAEKGHLDRLAAHLSLSISDTFRTAIADLAKSVHLDMEGD